MNKRDFEKILNSAMKDLSIDEKIELLDKMKVSWIPQIRNEKLKNYSFCKKCYRYYLTKKLNKVYEKKIREICNYSLVSSDDDTFAEVEQIITYEVCPICGYKKEIDSVTLRTFRKYGRGENNK